MTHSLADLRWKFRIVLVFTDGSADEAARAIDAWYGSAKAEWRERDLRCFIVASGHVGGWPKQDALAETPSGLRTRFDVAPGEQVALLLGKDGGEKLRGSPLIPTAELFAAIDAMPMRRQEMADRDR